MISSPPGRSKPYSAAFTAAIALAVFVAGCAPDKSHVVGSGTIELDEVDIASLVGGRLQHLFVAEGDSVEAGDTLAILAHGEIMGEVEARTADTERAEALWRDQQMGPRAAERKTAGAELDAATTSLKLADSELKRTQGLYARQLVSDADVDRASAARDEAAARRAAAEERLALVESGYRSGQIVAARGAADAAKGELFSSKAKAHELILTAPIRGVVLIKSIQQGEVVPPGVPILTLGNPDKLWMRCYLSTPEVSRVKLGGKAEIKVLGWKDRTFAGHIIEIATRAEFTPRAALTEEERASVVFGVKIALDPSGGILKPGLPADARIETVAP